LIILPDKVTLQFRCPFDEAASIGAGDFSLVVDYNEFTGKAGGKITPALEEAPVMISHLQMTPQFVDGIIQNRY